MCRDHKISVVWKNVDDLTKWGKGGVIFHCSLLGVVISLSAHAVDDPEGYVPVFWIMFLIRWLIETLVSIFQLSFILIFPEHNVGFKFRLHQLFLIIMNQEYHFFRKKKVLALHKLNWNSSKFFFQQILESKYDKG